MATWSALHRELGLGPGVSLSHAHVQQAVEQRLVELRDLDWKRNLPANEDGKNELAKDAAAMANSGGGVLVFGVGEGPAPQKHPEVHEVPTTGEQVEQQIRAIISSRIRPYLAGVEVAKLENPEAAGSGFVVVTVPASPDAPHFYEKNGARPWVPRRNGPHTEHMAEQDVERAYRDRFRQRDTAEAALHEMVAHGERQLRFDTEGNTVWCVAVARPIASVAPGLPRADPAQVEGLIDAAMVNESDLLQQQPNQWDGAILGNLERRPRTGLRRWVLRHRPRTPEADGRTANMYAELWHDGSVMLASPIPAETVQGMPVDDARLLVSAVGVEHVAAGAVALTRTWHEALALSGYTALRMAIMTEPEERRPFWVWGKEYFTPFASPAVPDDSRPVAEVEPVDAILDATPTSDNNRAAAIELAEGVIHQFGYDKLESLASPSA